jgi:O-antigen/teichoic acid export membrane protein
VIWASLFIFPNILLLNMMIVANKQGINALFALVCLLTNIGLNLVLIPRYGFLGASAATVATDALLFVLSGYFASSHFGGLGIMHAGLKPVLCGVLLMLLLFVLQDVNFAYVLPIGIASYLILLLLTKTLSREDLLLFKKAPAIT